MPQQASIIGGRPWASSDEVVNCTATTLSPTCTALDVYIRGGGSGGGTVDQGAAGASPWLVSCSGSVAVSNFPATQAVTGPVTDAQMRAAPVPVTCSGAVSVSNFPSTQAVTGPVTDTQLRAAPVPVSCSGSVSVANFPATQPVSGPLTDAQLRASGVPVTCSGSVAVSNFPASQAVTGPLTDAQLRANAVPVSAAALPLPTGAATAAAQTDGTQRTKITDGVNVAAVQNTPAVGTEQGVVVRNLDKPSTLHVTATAVVNTGATCTLPAAGAGLFHYITRIELVKLYAVVGVASGAGVIVTSTNLPGSPAWTTEQLASPAGSAPKVIDVNLAGNPLKCSAANTPTTLVAPQQLQTIWRWNVTYYTGN